MLLIFPLFNSLFGLICNFNKKDKRLSLKTVLPLLLQTQIQHLYLKLLVFDIIITTRQTE